MLFNLAQTLRSLTTPPVSTDDKIAVATLMGQRTDPQTVQFIKWFSSQPKSQ